jgi:hypothetical protein
VTSKTDAPQRAITAQPDLNEQVEAGFTYDRTLQRVPDRETGPWLLVTYWQELDGRRECVGMKLTSIATAEEADDPPGLEMPRDGQVLTTSLLRDLRLSEQIQNARAAFEQLGRREPEKPAGLRQSTWERLQLAARIYREAFAGNGKPTSAVAAHFGLSVGGASNLVSRARDVGLLPPTSRGASHG